MTGASGVGLVARLRARAWALKRETYVLYLACRDPRTPWYAKALAGGVVAYALSPIDLVPDFIPVIGYLDDLIIVPLGISAALRMIPATVLDDCRVRADEAWDRPKSRRVAALIVGIWLALTVLALWLVYDLLT
jgi:uncharacterized membrane protein YkvA (DUF1232 family)